LDSSRNDQLVVGEMVRRALANEPIIVFHFCSKSATAVTTAQRIAPTIILQDLVMPGIEGLRWVRTTTSWLPNKIELIARIRYQ